MPPNCPLLPLPELDGATLPRELLFGRVLVAGRLFTLLPKRSLLFLYCLLFVPVGPLLRHVLLFVVLLVTRGLYQLAPLFFPPLKVE